MRILITGANGFIGSRIVNYYATCNKDIQVNILIRKTSNTKYLQLYFDQLKVYYGDVRDKESLIEPIKNSDLIIHCAAVLRCIHTKTYYEVNYLGTKNIVDITSIYNPNIKGIIYISSQAAAGPSNCLNYKSCSDISLPVSHYGKSKFLAEKAVLKYSKKIKTIILRPAAVYGPYDKDMFVYFQLAQKGILPVFNANFYIQFVYIYDLVKIISLVVDNIEKIDSSIYFIAEERCYSIKQIKEIFQKIVGKNVMLLNIPYFIGYIGAYINEQIYKILYNKPAIFNRDKLNELARQFWLCNSSEILKIFTEFKYTPLIEGMKNTYDWYKQNKWL